ncbi:cyclic nucleotide-binding domain-containing protein [Actinotalea ferrariae]|uniref:cyclic nucleotide-binding domain-containing protein n=1 Tax=Actinotalea ferrariae TaxID=1386098 RepID=UPI001C8CDA35|nr:cyclic nucleotide-binding domain-containing protein [Actinotalea ferrariae]MBX9243887.1 cyclic nucleotide-binding domain-containing protein [Actinotalea ferrariae]
MPATTTVTRGVTSLSWIPSELLVGPMRMPFELGLTHYDEPPPDVLHDVEALRRAGRFRFVNRVRLEVETDGGTVTAARPAPGHGGVIGLTNLLGGAVRFPAVKMPDLTQCSVAADGSAAVVRQTVGGRAPLPAPRLVRGRGRLVAPLVWTTLELVVRADGSASHRVLGASAFPRHWVYGDDERLVEKVAVTDSTSWLHDMTEDDNPWRGVDAPALTAPVETQLERRLSGEVMDRRPSVRRLAAGQALFRQGEPGGHVALLLDGVVAVVRDGTHLADIGPGAILGERALLEGSRTATVVAVTPVTVAVLDGARLSRDDLALLVEGHRREDAPPA